jgi:S-adenosylmethionine:tRNA ribosyltransferase-isomerase
MTATMADQPTTQFPAAAVRIATEPPESRGLTRDQVRMLVARPGGVTHTDFRAIADQLEPGDLVVVNTSATVNAELDVDGAAGPAILHVATPLDDGTWIVELRTAPDGARAVLDAPAGSTVGLPGGGQLRLLQPYPDSASSPTGHGSRLWRASAEGLPDVLARYGRPIAYGYLSRRWPLADYQTIFGRHPGSAEMPSAGRPFSGTVLAALAARGVRVAPITLHTGVSSQEAGEGPQAERFTVPATTARLVNATRADGGRVVAVGTTVTRAVESAAGPDRQVVARSGWTDLVLGPHHPVRVINGLITGWHDPEASHLLLVEAIAGPRLTQQAYDAALAHRYRWHEFGDSCLFLP